ncbi:Uncharacterised protein [Candidatus Gugararchaeum adminiculabundum]|nr:Uncharacterised protein [Candidatus Gugararchaeum adminiculabundum]
MVLGLFEGNVKIELPKTTYAPGEPIKGKLLLKLNSQKNARELRIALVGEQVQTHTTTTRGHRSSSKETETVYELKKVVKGSGMYTTSEYEFELAPPASAIEQWLPQPSAKPGGILGSILGHMGPKVYPVRWYLRSSLDLPKAFDVKGHIEIQFVR